jgi:hypothetical protein
MIRLGVLIAVILIVLGLLLLFQNKSQSNIIPLSRFVSPALRSQKYQAINQSFPEKHYFFLSDAGLFSELNSMINAVLYCLIQGKQFVLVDKEWNMRVPNKNNSWNEYFENFCEVDNSISKGDSRAITRFYAPMWGLIGNYEILTMGSPLFDTTDILTRRRIIIEFVFRPLCTPMELRIVAGETKNFDPSTGYIAVHIRGGDKLILEMKNIPLTEYADAIRDAQIITGLNTIVYCSDDSRKIKELDRMLPDTEGWAIPHTKIGHQQNSFNRLLPGNKQEEFRLLISEIHYLLHADYLVCTFTSNVSRFVACMRGELETSFSLDDQWGYT